MTAEIEHVTVTTGGSRISPRSEVSNGVVALIRTSLADHEGQLADTGWRIDLIPSPPGGHIYDLIYRGARIARCWLCIDAEAADYIWLAATAGAPAGTRLHRPMTLPWLAAGLMDGAVTAGPDALMTAGDLERCVAWALIE
ncbi:hypothetical protein [Xanthobacter sediminis]